MNNRNLSAGDLIEAQCTRCRKLLNHTIVAMVETRVVRVECNTCRGMHNYRPAKEPTATRAPRASGAGSANREKAPAVRSTKKDPGDADREEWALLRPSMDEERVLAYDMNGTYRVNDLVSHVVFGLGVIRRLTGPNKMEVLFQGGKKLLRCQ
jgi:hypothetical protein